MIEATSGASSAYYTMPTQGMTPPSAEDMAAKMNEAVESGSIDGAEIQAKLTERFGDAAEGIVQEDGSLDTEKLTSLIEEAKASGQFGPPPSLSSSEADDANAMLQDYLDAMNEEEEEETSLVEQLYGQAASGSTASEELFSIVA